MSPNRRTARIIGSLAAIAALALTGCGSDDESADDTTTSEPTTTEETTTTTDGDGSDDGGAGDGGSGSGVFTSDECQQLAEAFDQDQLADVGSGADPTDQLEEAARFLTEAADDAPDEIAGDVDVMAEVYSELARVSGEIDWEGLQSGDPSAIAGVTELSQVYASNPDFATAAQNLTEWTAQNCTPAGIGG